MQHVLVVLPDVDGEPVAEPFEVNVWRDDRLVMWQMNAEGWQWSNELPPKGAGPNQAVFIDPSSEWYKDGGTQPMPIGPLVFGFPDRRFYAAMGPMPAAELKTYTYDMWAHPIAPPDSGIEVKVVKVKKRVPPNLKASNGPIDPDISNQPHP